MSTTGTAGEIIREVLDVACAGDNWSNLTRAPSICLVGKDSVEQTSVGDTIFIRENNGEHENTLNRVPIFIKETCVIRITQANHDDRENAFLDIKTMFMNSSYAIVIRLPYTRENPRIELFTMEFRAEVSNI